MQAVPQASLLALCRLTEGSLLGEQGRLLGSSADTSAMGNERSTLAGRLRRGSTARPVKAVSDPALQQKMRKGASYNSEWREACES